MEFKEFVVSMAFAVQRLLPEEVEIRMQSVSKNNGVVWQGLMFRRKDQRCAPTIYLEPYYQAFQAGESLEELACRLADSCRKYADEPDFDPALFRSYEWVRSRVVYKLVHYKSNEKLLAEVPHLPYLDLAMIFCCFLSSPESGMATILIRNSHLNLWGISHRMLYEDARENTPRLLKARLQSMSQVLQLSEEETEELPTLYVLSNEQQTNGAACLLYEGVLERCAEQFQNHFYLLPSSIHEVLLLPYARDMEVGRMRSIVREINQTQVEPQEVLSDSVYFYSREQKKLLVL